MIFCKVCGYGPISEEVNVCPVCGTSIVEKAFSGTRTLSIMSLASGTLLQNGKYRIEDVIIQGGFSFTYSAVQTMLDVKVAIKELFALGATRQGSVVIFDSDSSESIGEFLNEGRILARLNHPGIVKVLDFFEENNTAYLVMEFLEGESLSLLLNRVGKIPENEALNYIKQVAQALKVVHDAGLLHQDVKPDNLVLTKEGRIVIVDFGSARQFIAEKTGNYDRIVTPGFAPLEQYGQRVRRGPYTDVYSLCANFYTLIKGFPPPPAPDRLQTLKELDLAGISPKIGRIISKGLEVNVNNRIRSMDELLAMIDEVEGKTFAVDKTISKEMLQREEGINFDDRKLSTGNEGIAYQKEIPDIDILEIESQEDPKVLFEIGLKYLLGFNVTRNFDIAFKCFREASEKGNADAMYHLGLMYLHGQGTYQDDKMAFKYFKEASEKGNADAMYRLGWMYEYGRGTYQDDKMAFKYFKEASEKGNADAMYHLGLMYLHGQGTYQDDKMAFKYFKEASEKGNADAMYRLGWMYEYGRGTSQDYKMAKYWYEKSKDLGNIDSKNKLESFLPEISSKKNKGNFIGKIFKNIFG
ncbi:TPR repeat-containing protein [Thermodesulfobium acidiphilum]|uniref:TPR repeat-containing protein n=1 Tax=Thermodesulfobium acidiphilum TaxID=1794699 RepID=A0A2R4VZJ8_THEAF|nr:serine/threonine-protein kinase [Thermodesulfobium acidiphilum]AWB09906.1 TPR repeat-containing protein [Thermodesulfobium acidiphilum]